MAAACKTCAKEASNVITLKRCAKCKTQWYCSRPCQRADWKNHKQTCYKNPRETFANTGSTSSTHNRAPPKGLSAPIDKPFHQLDSKTWLHVRPEKDVYKLLIDTYRLRMEDQYNFEGDADMDSIYGGAPDSRDGFRRFLRWTESRRGLLPSWWSPEKAAECQATGMRGGWSSLASAVEKRDILDHYGDSSMPMQMRMFGEQIYGTGPGGQPGAGMLQMMKQRETGEMHGTTLDFSNLMRRC